MVARKYQKCENCHYSRRSHLPFRVICVESPPTTKQRPLLSPADWCGRWEEPRRT